MENNKPIENSNEKGPEKIPSKAEILGFLMELRDGQTLLRVKEDDKGVYFLETSCPGKIEGETDHYEYQREGDFDTGMSDTTMVSHYSVQSDGSIDFSLGGGVANVGELNRETGKLEKHK